MRRIDVLIISIIVFAIGGAGYLGLKSVGFDNIDAGIWSQLLLVSIILAWLFSYIFRVATKKMTYTQQIKDYERSRLTKTARRTHARTISQITSRNRARKTAKTARIKI